MNLYYSGPQHHPHHHHAVAALTVPPAAASFSTATFVLFPIPLLVSDNDAILLLLILGVAQLVIQHLPRYGQKHILHIEVVFGGCLEQLNIHLSRKALRILRYNHLAIRIIVLISHCKREKVNMLYTRFPVSI